MALKKETVKYLESEVVIYHKTKAELKYAPNDDLNPSSTRTCESLLAEQKRFKRMNELTAAIEYVFNQLNPDKQKLVEIHYWNRRGGLSLDALADQLYVNRRTVIRWRNEFIELVAVELGER